MAIDAKSRWVFGYRSEHPSEDLAADGALQPDDTPSEIESFLFEFDGATYMSIIFDEKPKRRPGSQ